MESLALKRFSTLLQREWLQHKTGWIVVACAPLLVAALVLLVGQINLDVDGQDVVVELGAVPALVLASAVIIGTGVLTFLLAWGSSLLQTPGLARRDQQDRSIEFWLSLPVGHGSSLAAPMLAHLLLFPLAALGIGMLAGHVVSLLVVARFVGLADWFALPWGALTLAWVSLTARATLGLLLATLWLSPLILLVMAASAWLKRWGLPALIASIAVINGVLDKLYGNPWLWDFGQQLFTRAGQSFLTGKVTGGLKFGPGRDPVQEIAAFPGQLLQDAGHAIAALADPLLMPALAVAAGCFGLLVLRRRQGN